MGWEIFDRGAARKALEKKKARTRPPDYFRQIAAKRKRFGRLPKERDIKEKGEATDGR